MGLATTSGLVVFLFLFNYAVKADIGNFDAVWRQRAKAAAKHSSESFEPNPSAVAAQLNSHVHMTRQRRLGETGGACQATNPIDVCWRCKANWADDRKAYANCALGIGKKAGGGKDGKIYVVTDSSDNDMVDPKNGTLRHAVIQKEPLWIIFEKDMNIVLKGELIIAPDKTIDGRGANVHITKGAGFTLQSVRNVIITNLHMHDIVATPGGMIRASVDHYGKRTVSDGDAINIFGSSDIWIDHVTMSKAADGLIDAVEGSTAITISNIDFSNHDHVMLLNANTSSPDNKMQVTIAYNHFGKGLTQRLPKVLNGFAHVVNNDYTEWGMYAIGGSMKPSFLCQGNRFAAGSSSRTKEVTKRALAPESEWKNWAWVSQGDVMENGAFFVESGSPAQKQALLSGDLIKPKDGSLVSSLTQSAGALNCKVGSPC